MTTKRQAETVIGEVGDVHLPRSLTSPAIIILKTDAGVEGELKFWPKKDRNKVLFEPVQLGEAWDSLVEKYGDPPDELIGKTIVAIAYPAGERNGLAQWSDPRTVKVIGAQPKEPVDTVDTPVSKPSAKPPVVDRQDQIMLQHATNVSAICYNAWLLLPEESRGPFADYLKKVAMGGTWLLKHVYIPGGYSEEPKAKPELEYEIDPLTLAESDPEDDDPGDAVLGTI